MVTRTGPITTNSTRIGWGKKMSRQDVIAWFVSHSLPVPPKSSCVFCPYQSDAAWSDMKDNEPEDFTIVSSPPYYALRDYGVVGQLGLEKTPEEFIANMVKVFREAWRVLRDDGTLWVNIGDSYASTGGKSRTNSINTHRGGGPDTKNIQRDRKPPSNLKNKDLIGIPWMLALALRADGWYLRQDIIWSKPNPMPESISDRCTKAHEYIFLLSKRGKYYFDPIAISEPCSASTHARISQDVAKQKGSARAAAKINGPMKAVSRKLAAPGSGTKNNSSFDAAMSLLSTTRNKRSVWTITTQSFSEAHFATFPTKLPMECIKAGTSEYGCCSECGAPYSRILEASDRYAEILGTGYHDHSQDAALGNAQNRGRNMQHKMRDAGMYTAEYVTKGWSKACKCEGSIVPCRVLDPFMGAGTTALAARLLSRNYSGLELNPEYIVISEKRLSNELGMFL